MARWSRRRSTRRSRRSSIAPLIALLVLAVLLLILLANGNTIRIPGLRLPPVPNITIPITGFPKIEIPNIAVQITEQPQSPATGANPAWGKRTKTAGCVAQGALPDPSCTPGAVFPNVTSEQVCQSGYSRSVRNVPQSVKDDVYAEYGIASHTAGQYEVDHLVSLELGGSNDIANLWPEPASPNPGFHEKDKVENYLHDQVCSGNMSLQDAQRQIATNWMDVYNRMPK